MATSIPPYSGPPGVLPAQSIRKAGFIPPFQYVPEQGPNGIPAAYSYRDTPGIPPPYNSGRGWGIAPAVPVGGGYFSQLTDKVNSMDVVNGMDRTLGKTQTISLGKRAQQSVGHYLGNLSTHQALGEFSGRFPQHYGRMFDATA